MKENDMEVAFYITVPLTTEKERTREITLKISARKIIKDVKVSSRGG
ncbi:hypothetical protein [Serratia liquefaciens]|nr:hypothetical protein [Serratia liquefaciens]